MSDTARIEPFVYEVGPFTIDPAQGLLFRGDEPVPLTPKVFDTLLVLVENAGRVLTRDFLMDRIWPDAHVSDTSLSQNIWLLRKTLGDDEYIETVPRRGYRFKADVRRRAALPFGPVDAAPIPDVAPARETFGVAASAVTAAAVVAAIVLTSIIFFLLQSRFVPREPDAARVRITRLTSSGHEICAAISPDGKFLAHVVVNDGMSSLLLRQIGTTHDIELTEGSTDRYPTVAFAPDGQAIFFTRVNELNQGAMWKVPTLGGSPVRVLSGAVRGPFFSPDGRRMIAVTFGSMSFDIVMATPDGKVQKVLLREVPRTAPAWTRDGSSIAFVSEGELDGREELSIMNISTGAVHVFPRWQASNSGRYTLSDVIDVDENRTLMVEGVQGNGQIRRAHRDGTVTAITNDFANYTSPTISDDGTRLAAVQTTERANLWTVRVDTGEAKQLTTGLSVAAGRSGVDFLNPSTLVYESEWNLWTLDLRTRERTQITQGQDSAYPAADRAHGDLYYVNRAGVVRYSRTGPSELIARDMSAPVADRQGRWLVYTRGWELCRRSFATGHVRCGEPGWRPAFSPDGEQLVAGVGPKPPRFAIFSTESLKVTRRLDFPVAAPYWAYPTWTPDGRGIAFVRDENGVANIWVRPLDGSPDRRLTNFDDQLIYSFVFSPDGKELIVSRGERISEVVLIEGEGAEARLR